MKLATLFILFWAIAAGASLGEDPDAAFSVAAVLRDRAAFDRPHDIELQGDLAFVPGKGGSLAIVDVANPDQPKLLCQRHDDRKLAEAETVLVAKGRLFLGTHDLHAIDVSQPETPVFQARVSDRKRIRHINGMVCRRDTIFAASKHGWLDAFDISDPVTPTLAGAVNLREKYSIASSHEVDLFGEFAVVADPAQFAPRKHPVKLASQRFAKPLANAEPRDEGGGDSGHDLVYREGVLYVTGQNDHCLVVLRVESAQVRALAAG